MTAPLHIDADRLHRLLSPLAAVDALAAAILEGVTDAPQRSHLDVPGGELLLMPAAGPRDVGVKLVTLNPRNAARGLPLIGGVFVLFDGDTLATRLTLDGAALTSLRTAAVSALATRHLALPGARRLVLFGAGAQAYAHLEAMQAVLPIEQVVVVDTSRERAEALAAAARERGLEGAVGTPDAVRDADVVCTCTTSSEPVFDGTLLRAGAHVNAIGAYRPDLRELDDALLARALVVVEQADHALAEAGDLIQAIASGAFARERIAADLAALVGGAAVRTSEHDVTVFKSVGVAWEDLVVAAAAADAAVPEQVV